MELGTLTDSACGKRASQLRLVNDVGPYRHGVERPEGVIVSARVV